jgi:hypothetical protein
VELRDAVDKSDFELIKEAAAPKGIFDRTYPAMLVFATAFSDSVISGESTQLRQATRLLKITLEKLDEAATAKDKEGVIAIYKKGTAAVNMYINAANAAIPYKFDKFNVLE